MFSFIGAITFLLVVILQSAIFSQIFLLRGTADVVMLAVVAWSLNKRIDSIWGWGILSGLLVGLVSELPLWLPVLGYVGIAWLAQTIRKSVWQVPLFALFAAVAASTVFLQLITIGFLVITGIRVSFVEAFNQIMLPSILLNLLFAIPVSSLINEIISLMRPDEIEI